MEMYMEIRKEFAPITIYIDTKEELTLLKSLANAAVSYDPSVRHSFLSGGIGKDWFPMARRLLEI